MRTLRIFVVVLTIAGLSTSAFAGDLKSSIDQAGQTPIQGDNRPMPKPYLWAGSALFVGGMAVGVYGFLNNRNGKFPQADEANATNKHLGTAGLVTAFAGGAVLALGGRRARHAPAVTIAPGRIGVTKQLRW